MKSWRLRRAAPGGRVYTYCDSIFTTFGWLRVMMGTAYHGRKARGAPTSRDSLLRSGSCLFQNPLAPRRIKYSARAKPGQVGDCLLGRSPALLHPVNHLLGQGGADHTVAAHGRELEHVLVRQVLGLALEAQRVSHTVAADVSRIAALLRPIDGRRDIDAKAQVFGLHRLHKVLSGRAIVEHRGRGGSGVESCDHGGEVRDNVAI